MDFISNLADKEEEIIFLIESVIQKLFCGEF